MKRTACVIQGDLRCDALTEIIRALRRHCDVVILSTWFHERSRAPSGDYELVTSLPPENLGTTNRNAQRVSTAAGIACAKSLGFEYVLKWRTDVLPTTLNLCDLERRAHAAQCGILPSRIVVSAFRSVNVEPDWFSSLPDMYCYGHVDALALLWKTEQLDFSRKFNIPTKMIEDLGLEVERDEKIIWMGRNVTTFYNAHIEFYALFRDVMEKRVGKPLDFITIMRDYMALHDHNKMGLCWFKGSKQAGFRSIAKSNHIRWLTTEQWEHNCFPDPTPLDRWLNCSRTEYFLNRLTLRWNEFKEIRRQRHLFLNAQRSGVVAHDST